MNFHLPSVLTAGLVDVGDVVLRRLAHIRAVVRSGGTDPSGALIAFTWYDDVPHGQNYVRGEKRVEIDVSGVADVLVEDHDLCACVWKVGCATESRHVETHDGEGTVTIDLVPEAVFRGRVVDPNGGGVAGAEIKAYETDRSISVGEMAGSTTTDTVGAFALHGLGAGHRYSLMVWTQAAMLLSSRFSVSPPDEDVVLTLRRGGLIKVEALAPERLPRSLPHWFIAFKRDESTGRWTRRCSYGGYVTEESESGSTFARTQMSGHEPGTYRVLAHVDGFAQIASPPFEVRSGEVSEVSVHIEAGRSVAGRIVDPRKSPVQGATLTLDLDGVGVETESGEDGRFEFKDLPTRPVTLDLTAAGFLSSRLRVEDGQTQLEDVVIVPSR